MNIRNSLNNTPGPNKWNSLEAQDFGPEHDYEVFHMFSGDSDYKDDYYVINPISEAALQWGYAKLPEDVPRWGERGFKIEPAAIDEVRKAMYRDGLYSEQEYADAIEECNQLLHQWERL